MRDKKTRARKVKTKVWARAMLEALKELKERYASGIDRNAMCPLCVASDDFTEGLANPGSEQSCSSCPWTVFTEKYCFGTAHGFEEGMKPAGYRSYATAEIRSRLIRIDKWIKKCEKIINAKACIPESREFIPGKDGW
ncbi:MAG: hypothetical protein KAR06_11090 [Deltaproteobacteria bacterium]|nr:hypothetical protein [Deltaproteobacteria bacterium]